MTPDKPEGRSSDIVDGAIKILGSGGARALTHRAVDRELGLAEGSTSNYFRTREALLAGVFKRICEIDLLFLQKVADLCSDMAPGLESVVEVILTAVDRFIVEPSYKQRQRARIEIYLISAGDPKLAKSVGDFRETFRTQLGETFAAMGIPVDPVGMRLVIALADGMILDELIAEETSNIDRAVLQKTWTGYLKTLVERES